MESWQGFGPIDLIPGLLDEVVIDHTWPKLLETFEELPTDGTYEVAQGKLTCMLSILFINKRFCFLIGRTRPYAEICLTSFWKKDNVKNPDCTNNHWSLVIRNCTFSKEEFWKSIVVEWATNFKGFTITRGFLGLPEEDLLEFLQWS